VATIVLHRAAKADLEELWDSAPEVAAGIFAVLEEAKQNQAVMETLTTHDFGAYQTDRYHVSVWAAQQSKGRNLWRLKIWEFERHAIKYRVIYAFDPRIQRYFVLGVFDRDFNYDESDARTKRVIEAYDRLDIPSYQ